MSARITDEQLAIHARFGSGEVASIATELIAARQLETAVKVHSDGALKCSLCDTTLQTELPDGRIFEFTKHTESFCRDLTLYRIAMLQQCVRSAIETITHKVEHHIHVIDKALEEAGAKTFKTRAAEAELRAQVAKELDLLPRPELLK